MTARITNPVMGNRLTSACIPHPDKQYISKAISRINPESLNSLPTISTVLWLFLEAKLLIKFKEEYIIATSNAVRFSPESVRKTGAVNAAAFRRG